MYINKAASGSPSPFSKQIVSFSVLFALILQSVLFAVPSKVAATPRAFLVSPDIVISQVYGGGGNSGSTFKNDFIELFNRGTSAVSITGWSVQYAATTGTSWQVTALTGTIAPGKYYLVQEAAGTGGTVSLPTPDATGSISMAAGAGKVALVTTATNCGVTSNCGGGAVRDFVGYGSGTNAFEGTGPTATIAAATAAFRAGGGCVDTDNNAGDFTAATTAPRNSSTAAQPCSVVNSPPIITAPADPITTVAQDAAPFTVGLTGSDGNNIFIWSATLGTGVSNAAVTGGQGTSNVTYTVTLTPGFSGIATFTAGLSDTVNVTTRTVNVAVTPTPRTLGPLAISQIYGGGGNTGSTLKNDYIELINRSAAPVSLNGWSVQVFSTTTSSWVVTPLSNFLLQPGQYYLIQEAQGTGGTDDLPNPDATGTITVSSTSSKVALVNSTTALTGNCPTGSGLVDFVGYGDTTGGCFEGSGPAPLLTNTTAALRLNEGCFDTNNNANDFISEEPDPRNSSSPTNDCTGISGFGSANPSTILQGQSTTLTLNVAGGQNPDSTGVTAVADLSSIGGSATQAFAGSGNTFTFTATVPAGNPPGLKSLPVTINDAQARSFQTDIKLSVLSTIPDHIVISQVYGGGGNSGASYTNDYVELYNPTGSTVTITGWTLQYASAAGTSWTNNQPLGGTIGPNNYYLVKLASGGANGAPLPVAPNISGDINMSATTGKIALVKNSDPLIGGGCPIGIDADIVDFVGYGGASCHEGNANAPAPSNSTALLRKNAGATDTNQNGDDFVAGVPNPRSTEPVAELGPWVAGTDPTTNGATIPHDATVTVNFSEPVDVDPGWYNINCVATGLHNDATVAHTSDFKTYAITPNINFAFGEKCTVTIPKTAIHDQDTDDSAPNTDTLFADYVWSFTVVAAGSAAPFPQSIHLAMGNPSGATADVSNFNDYLMQRSGNALSYNRSKGTPNWVSWHLDSAWYGTLARVDTFRADPQVPADWYRVEGFDYSGTGFDRGHMTPNADRDNQNRTPVNQETYLMSNMVPQAPDNNQGPWAQMEGDLRTIADSGKELFIVSGPLGVGGTGSNGGTTTSIANGHVTVPAFTWKVVLQLPHGVTDPSQVGANATTFAVMMPNTNGIRSNPWQGYKVTVRQVEQATGLNFFSNIAPAVQNSIENGLDGANPPGTGDQSVQDTEDTPVQFTLNAVNPLNTTLTVTTSQPSHGSVSCVSINCTYTPQSNFNGTDSFTFSVNNGSLSSNTSTVSVSVSAVNDPPVANAQSVSTDEDTAQSVTLTGSDTETASGALTYTVTQGPAHGSLNGSAPNLTYTPASNYNGSDSFKFTVTDTGDGSAAAITSSEATVSITVNAVNDAPTANSQAVTTDEDTAKTILLTGNDIETAVSSLVYTVTQGPANGILSGTAPNLTYTPAANYNGSDSFKFKVTDTGDGASAALSSTEAMVTITVNPVNDAPSAISQSVTLDEDTAKAVTLAGTDTETAAASLIFTVTQNPAHGALSGTGANRTYTPAADFNGSDSFKFTVTDTGDGPSAALTSSEATVSITVNAVNDPPTATNLSAPEAYIINTSLDLTDIVVADVDSTVSVTLTLSDHAAGSLTTGTSGSTTSTYDAATGIWTASGPPAEVNVLLANLSFVPAANFSSNFSIATAVTDGFATLTGLKTVTVIDTQAPTTSPAQSPAANSAGWNNTDTNVILSATDNPGGSGVGSVTYSTAGAQSIAPTTVSGSSASVTISAEGITTVTYFATDNKGNSESAHTLTVKVDKTGPSISSSRTPSANGAGWNNTDVTANYTASDAGSGLDAGSPASGSNIFSGEGANQSHTFTVTDIAGNSTSSTVANVKIDKNAPIFTSFPGDQTLTATSINGAAASWSGPTAGDNLSGVASIGCSAASGSVFPIGMTSVSCTTADAAGNTRSQGFTINVVKAVSQITVSAPADLVNGGNAVLSAVLTGTGNAPLAGRSIAFSLGSGPGTQTCSAVTVANGSATCTITNISQPNGSSVPVTATFSPTGGDGYYLGSSSTANVTVNGTAVVTRHRPSLSGGTVTGGLRVLLGEAFNVNSGTTLTDLYLVGTPTLTRNNGSFGTIVSDGGAATPAGYQVTLNGGNITSTHRQSDAVTFPADIPSSVPSPTATRQVTVNSASDLSTIGNWATVKTLTVNLSNVTINVPAGTYHTFTMNGSNIKLIFGVGTYNFANTIVLNNNSNIEFGGAATVNIASPLTLNSGKMLVGSGISSSDVKVNVLATVTFNSNSEIDAELRVPNSVVIFNGGNATVKGNIWADGFTLNGNSQVVCNSCIALAP